MERFAAQLALAALRGLAGPPECLRLRLDCLRLLLDRLQTPPRSPGILHENLLPTIHDSISSQAIPRPTVSERYNPVAGGMGSDLFQAPIRCKTPHFRTAGGCKTPRFRTSPPSRRQLSRPPPVSHCR